MEQGAASIDMERSAMPQDSTAMGRLMSDLNEEERLLVCLLRNGVRMSDAEMQHLNQVFLRLINNRVNTDETGGDGIDQRQNVGMNMSRRASAAGIGSILKDVDSTLPNNTNISNNNDVSLFDLQARRQSLFGGISIADDIPQLRRGSLDSMAGMDVLRRTSLDLLVSEMASQQRRLSNASFGRRTSLSQLLTQDSLFQDPITQSPNVPIESHDMEQLMDDSMVMNGLLSGSGVHPRSFSLQQNKNYDVQSLQQSPRLPQNTILERAEALNQSHTRPNGPRVGSDTHVQSLKRSSQTTVKEMPESSSQDHNGMQATEETSETDKAPLPEIIVTFQSSMSASQKSQQDIQQWDKKMGLKRSHSSTMTKTTQSRNKLRKLFESSSILSSI